MNTRSEPHQLTVRSNGSERAGRQKREREKRKERERETERERGRRE